MHKPRDIANARTLRRAFALIHEGKVDEGYNLMADMPYDEFRVAAELIAAQGSQGQAVRDIAKRNGMVGETVGDILRGAAKAGDREAIELIADGFLQEKFIDAAE